MSRDLKGLGLGLSWQSACLARVKPIPVIPECGRERQENQNFKGEFKASLAHPISKKRDKPIRGPGLEPRGSSRLDETGETVGRGCSPVGKVVR